MYKPIIIIIINILLNISLVRIFINKRDTMNKWKVVSLYTLKPISFLTGA